MIKKLDKMHIGDSCLVGELCLIHTSRSKSQLHCDMFPMTDYGDAQIKVNSLRNVLCKKS